MNDDRIGGVIALLEEAAQTWAVPIVTQYADHPERAFHDSDLDNPQFENQR